MAAIHALAAYGVDSDSEGNESNGEETTADHTAHLNTGISISQLQSKMQLKSAPEVTAKVNFSSSYRSLRLVFLFLFSSSSLFLFFKLLIIKVIAT